MTAYEIRSFLEQEFPDNPILVEFCENRRARLRLDINHSLLRPGGTIYGASMILLADTAMYATILTIMGEVVLAVTTNLNINFLRKPELQSDLLEESWLMKVSKRLTVGGVIIYSQGDPESVAHATCTFSIPPQSNQINKN